MLQGKYELVMTRHLGVALIAVHAAVDGLHTKKKNNPDWHQ